MSAKAPDLTGEVFGRLTVIKEVEPYVSPRGNKSRRWLCECECGNMKVARSAELTRGKCKSCGCLRSECSRDRTAKIAFKHGFIGKKIYKVYIAMIERCYKPSNSEYRNYGGRGIIVCKEWRENRESFFKWAMENGYKEDLTIDRIDNNGNYEPSNCRWATMKEQSNNRRTNILLTYNGETHTLKEWSELTGISYMKMYQRYRSGKSLNDIFWKGDLGNGIKGRTAFNPRKDCI